MLGCTVNTVSYCEAGWMDYLCTVGTFHQNEGRVSSFLLIGLLADLTYCRQRKPWLEGPEGQGHKKDTSAVYEERHKRATYRETLP